MQSGAANPVIHLYDVAQSTIVAIEAHRKRVSTLPFHRYQHAARISATHVTTITKISLLTSDEPVSWTDLFLH